MLLLLLLKAAACMFLKLENSIYKHPVTARWDYKSESQTGDCKSIKILFLRPRHSCIKIGTMKKFTINAQVSYRHCQKRPFCSWVNSCHNCTGLPSHCPVDPSSLWLLGHQPAAWNRLKEDSVSVNRYSSEFTLCPSRVQTYSFCSLAPFLLVNLVITTHSGPVYNTTAIVMHNWRSVSSQWQPVKDSFQMSAAVDWTQFPIFIHKLQWLPLWPRDKGQMPRPRSCRLPSSSQRSPSPQKKKSQSTRRPGTV